MRLPPISARLTCYVCVRRGAAQLEFRRSILASKRRPMPERLAAPVAVRQQVSGDRPEFLGGRPAVDRRQAVAVECL